MKGYALSPQATDDIFVIWAKIARDSTKAANDVQAAIYRNCELLAQ